VSVLASYIRILGYLLGHPPSRASLLVLLFLFLRVLLLYILVSILASHIYILGYLLGRLPSRANLLILLFLFLGVLLLYFLPLLGLFRAFRYLPPIVLTIL